jgi:Fuc2NAc and GlcNAc transferase
VIVIIGIAVFLTSVLVTGLVRKYALHRQLLDVPNARSSHTVPTPRGGGVGIVAAFLLGLPVATYFGLLSMADAAVLALPGLATAAIGFADDHTHIPARWRLLGHFAVAGIGLALLTGLPSVPITDGFSLSGAWLAIPLAVGLVWLLNLYNFMDGIDGIAGVQAVTVCSGMALLSYLYGNPADVVLALLLAAASAGFLCWNLPPARIFMGDAGSGFLGVAIGLLWLKMATANPQLFWPGLILMGVFVVDATWTLVVRLMRGEKVYEAHRSHAYQHAARRFGGHGRVTLAVAVINVGWLLPVGCWVASGSVTPIAGVGAATVPILIAPWALRAGRLAPEGRL